MIRHHPADATLLACAAGTLLPLHARVVAVHLEHCPACRATLGLAQEVGGALVDSLPSAPLGHEALAQALARLDQEPMITAEAIAPPTMLSDLARGRWRWVGLGIRLMPLVPRDATGTRLDLIRVAPGTALPQHDHTGPEITCVLQGAFADITGDYGVGDVAEGDVGLDHQPTTLGGEDCICLIATTGRLRAHSLVARLLQPVFGV